MLAFHLLAIFCCLQAVNTENATITFTAFDSSGQALPSPGFVPVGSTIQLRCSFPGFITRDVSYFRIFTRLGPERNYDAHIQCTHTYQMDSPVTIDVMKHTNYAQITKDASTCDLSNFKVNVALTTGSHAFYKCDLRTQSGYATAAKSIVVQPYTIPDNPRLQQELPSGPVREGELMLQQCKSVGQPPPMLVLSYGGPRAPFSELIRLPPSSQTIEHEAILNWQTVADKHYHGKTLRCEITGHPSGHTPSVERVISIFYGPEDEPDQTEDWDINELQTKILRCNLDSHGSIKYQWYNGTSSSILRGHSSSIIALHNTNYDFIPTGTPKPIKRAFICRGTNVNNNNKLGQRRITVNISRNVRPYTVALIAISAIIVIVAIVLTLTVLILKRKRSRTCFPGKKRRRIAAR